MLSLSPKRLSTPIGRRQELPHARLTLFFHIMIVAFAVPIAAIAVSFCTMSGPTPIRSAFEKAFVKAVTDIENPQAMQEQARDNSGDDPECSFLERTRILSMA